MSQRQTYTKHPVIQRASASPNSSYPWDDDDLYDPPRFPNSAIRYQGVTTGQPPVIYSGKRKYTLHEAPPVTQPAPKHPQQNNAPRHRVHWMVFVGLAMLTMLTGWVLVTSLVNWWSTSQDDLHYGRPRTYQTDMVVDHADSASHPSHFIALNVNRHVEVIEFPGGDASKAKIYLVSTLIGDGQDLAVVTLTFQDVNGDGKLDMIVNVADSHFVYINDNGQFRPARSGEPISL